MKLLKVRAKSLGFYGNTRRKAGSEFPISPEHFSENWMEKIGEVDIKDLNPETANLQDKVNKLQYALNEASAENQKLRLKIGELEKQVEVLSADGKSSASEKEARLKELSEYKKDELVKLAVDLSIGSKEELLDMNKRDILYLIINTEFK